MIELQQVSRHFQVGDQTVHALDHVDLTIESGEFISIMGPSGSGKSTLLNILGLLDRPTHGSYRLNGADVAKLDDSRLADQRQQNIGFVFQSFHLIPRLNALENVELPMVLAGVPMASRRERARQVLQSMGLGERLDHRPDQLSGGERQRVAIGRAIVMNPKVLLADEPTGNLDSQSSKEVIDILHRLNRDGLSLLVVTHDPEIGGQARRRLAMRDGRIIRDYNGAPS
ncbi:MAG: ABC transporter ATP-binding protein [Proteobacteria bacterium]|nr:ABC transporter ATP-binding protein [Pseudomonadota bacterium]MYJ96382.1 ABC transporter ATP-binding protein [Pseudomonadota bacterium]